MEGVFRTAGKLWVRTGPISRQSHWESPPPCVYRKVCRSKANTVREHLL